MPSDRPLAVGAELGPVVGTSAAVGVVMLVLLSRVYAHRTRRSTVLARLAGDAERRTGMPGWVALPRLLAVGALLTALFGMLWDISLHVARGRDSGPLANPAHYFILVGLFLLFAAGMLAIVLPLDGDELPPSAVRIAGDWRAPVGGVVITGASFYALLGFPLDDLWHRLFGQDATLWSPTHLMLIGGAGLSFVGVLVLRQEGRAVQRTHASAAPWLMKGARYVEFGALLLGLSVFQAEYDFGVPQFRLVLQPVLIAGAGGCALVAARLSLGRGGALGTTVAVLVIRGMIAIVVAGPLDKPTPWFPLYVAEALLVELLGFTSLRRKELWFGAVAGLLIGTVGLAAESAWTAFVYPLPWTRDILVEALFTATPVGIAGGVVGGLLALGLAGRLPRPSLSRPLLVGALAVLALSLTNGLLVDVPRGATATVELTDAFRGGELVDARVSLDPADFAEDPAWIQLTARQGGGEGLIVDRLEQTGPGVYRSTRPIPVGGQWKTLLRVHDGRTLVAIPIYMPADPAINAPEIPVDPQFTREFGSELPLLQRERDFDAPPWLWNASSLFVLTFSIILVWLVSWCVGRLTRRRTGDTTETTKPPAGPTPSVA